LLCSRGSQVGLAAPGVLRLCVCAGAMMRTGNGAQKERVDWPLFGVWSARAEGVAGTTQVET